MVQVTSDSVMVEQVLQTWPPSSPDFNLFEDLFEMLEATSQLTVSAANKLQHTLRSPCLNESAQSQWHKGNLYNTWEVVLMLWLITLCNMDKTICLHLNFCVHLEDGAHTKWFSDFLISSR